MTSTCFANLYGLLTEINASEINYFMVNEAKISCFYNNIGASFFVLELMKRMSFVDQTIWNQFMQMCHAVCGLS